MKIGLQNFQGIGAYTEIPIAPITLFYGPNSAGKSTIVDAIEFLRKLGDKDLLARHARRDRKTQLLQSNYIGKPDDVVIRASSIFSASLMSRVFDDLSVDKKDFKNHHKGLLELLFPNGFDDVESENGVEFEYQLIYSQLNESDMANSESYGGKSFYLCETKLYVGGIPLFRVKLEDTWGYGHAELAFNIEHPSWDRFVDQQFGGDYYEQLDGYFGEDNGGLSERDANEMHPVSWHYADYRVGDPLGDRPFQDELLFRDEHGFANNLDSLQSRIFEEFINILMMMPPRCVAKTWRIMPIPPIRRLPEEFYVFNDDSPSWLHKDDCWKELADEIREKKFELEFSVSNDELKSKSALDFINHVLLSPDFLDTGYYITGDVKLLLDADVAINTLQHLDRNDLLNKLSKKAARVHPYLVYQPSNYRLDVKDVGVGISQVIPVLWACSRGGVSHIQQPELHLHPKLQAQLADVFIKAIHDGYHRFLIESHSEHLLLRLLRRIRETNQTKVSATGVIDLGKVRSRSLNADQVAVIYVKKNKDGLTTMKHLRLADDGEFIDRWPDGFFTDRDKELFGEGGPFA